jgi:transposase-like protein
LNHVVKRDHRAVKRIIRPMLGFKSFRSAKNTLAGVELMHMVRKGQLQNDSHFTPARQFYFLAA